MTEREALRLLHLDENFSQDQLRLAYRDLVKVCIPSFHSDDKAECPSSASARVSEDTAEEASGVSPSPKSGRSRRQVVVAAVVGAAVGVAVALFAVLREEPAPSTTLSAADVALSVAPQRTATRDSVDAARPESGADLLTAGERGSGQVAATGDAARRRARNVPAAGGVRRLMDGPGVRPRSYVRPAGRTREGRAPIVCGRRTTSRHRARRPLRTAADRGIPVGVARRFQRVDFGSLRST